MSGTRTDDERRVLYVLHRALSDLRYLALQGASQQAFELADALENIPGLLLDWKVENLDLVTLLLLGYEEKYGQAIGIPYSSYLNERPVPVTFQP